MASSIGIAATVFDPLGTLFIPRPGEGGAQKSMRGSRRVSRTATLDGASSFQDTGYAVSDRDLSVEVPDATREQIGTAAHLVRAYGEVTVCCSEGAFLCALESYAVSEGGALTVRCMVVGRIDE